MKKNCKFRIRLDSELMDKLRKEAEELDIPVSELVRRKLNPSSYMLNTLSILEDIQKKLNTKLNLNRR